ncbi:hypothetical protein [Nonomuraea recticatena]|uniref:hypothetical protein n=1 Tax=Nonomuraea recticatena TaxID=46178 RepID=UPI00361650DE
MALFWPPFWSPWLVLSPWPAPAGPALSLGAVALGGAPTSPTALPTPRAAPKTTARPAT